MPSLAARLLVLTGASGTGKTMLLASLARRDLPVQLIDADGYIGRSLTDADRQDGLQRLLGAVATAGRPCLCAGQIPPAELQALSAGMEVTWLWLTAAEPVRQARLTARGWSVAQVQEQRRWLVGIDFDVACREVAAECFDSTSLGPDDLASLLAAWIDRNVSVNPNKISDYSAWVQEAPRCASLQELANMIRRSPQLDYADLYHPLPFEEFGNLRTAVDKGQFAEKIATTLAAVSSALPTLGGTRPSSTVIDIGANGGAVSVALARAGYEVTAIEPDPSFYELGRRACNIAGVPIEWIKGALDTNLMPGRRFDAALVLSVFQWVAKGGEALEQAGQALRSITDRCDVLVLELGFNAGFSCLRTTEADHARVLLRMLLDYTTYSDFRLAGWSELYPGQTRFIYCCTGRRPLSGSATSMVE